MPLNVTVHSSLGAPQGVAAQAPTFDNNTSAFTVAMGSQSAAINGPALLCLVADEDERVSMTQTAGYSAPAATGVKLKSGVERYYNVGVGTWYINAMAG